MKPTSDFYADASRKTGVTARCKACLNATTARKICDACGVAKAAKTQFVGDDTTCKDCEVAAGFKRCGKCAERKRLTEFYSTKYKNKGGVVGTCKKCQYELFRDGQLRRYRRRTYGLTDEQYDAMVTRHGGKCRICLRKKTLHIDHCHATGKVRGLLCQDCNMGIGRLGDDPERLERAAEYLRNAASQKVDLETRGNRRVRRRA